VVEGALYVRGRLGAGVYLKAQFAKIALLEVGNRRCAGRARRC